MSDVAGAGPAEKRENDESPLNCGHSYCSKPFDVAALARLLLLANSMKLEVKSIEITSKVAIVSLDFTIFFLSKYPSISRRIWRAF